MFLITAMKCGEIHIILLEQDTTVIYVTEKTLTICKNEGYLSQARPIISYFKTVYMIRLI